jgi:hypothetical protein
MSRALAQKMDAVAKAFSMKSILLFFFITGIILFFTDFSKHPAAYAEATGKTLYDSIVVMDSLWEDAYNNCKMDVMESIISEDLEFYHDQTGLTTSKHKLNEALKVNICGKVTRVLKRGSLEVYPIKGYGAVELGLHAFHNIADADSQRKLHFSKFVHIWKKENGSWRMTRIISLH